MLVNRTKAVAVRSRETRRDCRKFCLKARKKVLVVPLLFPFIVLNIQWYRAVRDGPMVMIGMQQKTKRRLAITTSPILFRKI